MFNSEELFIDSFIACLAKLEIEKIPFDNNLFYNGVDCMKEYYLSNKENLGKYKNELGMLFIKKPLEGVYAKFRNVLSKQNGWYIAFINPEYEFANIKLDRDSADYVLANNRIDLDIEDEYVYNLARAFCKGANLI